MGQVSGCGASAGESAWQPFPFWSGGAAAPQKGGEAGQPLWGSRPLKGGGSVVARQPVLTPVVSCGLPGPHLTAGWTTKTSRAPSGMRGSSASASSSSSSSASSSPELPPAGAPWPGQGGRPLAEEHRQSRAWPGQGKPLVGGGGGNTPRSLRPSNSSGRHRQLMRPRRCHSHNGPPEDTGPPRNKPLRKQAPPPLSTASYCAAALIIPLTQL